MVDYEQAYRRDESYFGRGANPFVVDHVDQIAPGGRVLDVGIGQGRNGLELARRGFAVTGLDLSAAAIATTGERAAREGLAVTLHQTCFGDFDGGAEPYDAVLLCGLLQELERPVHAQLLGRIADWTAPGSLLLLTAWHVDDPRYEHLSRTATAIGRHSFRTAAGAVRTYLERDEIVQLLPDWQLVHHVERLGPRHRHGDSEPEQHGTIEVVARRRPVA